MLASQFFFEAEHSLQLVGHPQLLGDGAGICSKQPNPRPMPFLFMTHSRIEDSATVDMMFPTSGISVVLKNRRVPTEDLEKLPRWLLEKSSDERVK